MTTDTVLPATLIWTRQGIPSTLTGRIGAREGDALWFHPEGIERPDLEERCVLCLEGPDHEKVTARVMKLEDRGILLQPGRSRALRRYYPRIDTPASFVFRVIEPGPAAGSLSKRQLSVLKAWARPVSQEMNLGVDGLAFLSDLALPIGSRVHVRLRLPDSAQVDHSLVGEVVRSTPESFEGEDYHRIALHLATMSPETHQALVDYTLAFQDEVLEHLERKPGG